MLALLAVGCTIDAFQLVPSDASDGGGASKTDAAKTGLADGQAPADGEADSGDAAADGPEAGLDSGPCVPSREICDGRDNDCDGKIDEDFDLSQDPRNCGACNITCDQPGTVGMCVNGSCQYQCRPGFIDLDSDLKNGCEYACVTTAGGVEVCDGIDNDCDGKTDEGFDLNSDVKNCGKCLHECLAVNGTPSCNKGACVYKCDSGYADILSSVPGCEYKCPVTPPFNEICDTVDNDCDGEIDEDVPGVGESCADPGFEQYGGIGECAFGKVKCVAGIMQCVGYVGPSEEVCDNRDNDCDGETDEGFDKLAEVKYCNNCKGCHPPHAVAECVGGQCGIKTCVPGFIDADGKVDTGCEYECTPSGPEVCDGLDNDCDRLTDEADPDLAPPSVNFCRTAGACEGTEPSCTATACDPTVKWRCVYPEAAETENCDVVLEESVCDGIDGDCDGLTDETFPLKGTACADNGVGACQGTGSFQCNGQGDGVECVIDKPGADPSPEVCNGIDDDCDGQTDEDVVDDLVEVNTGSLHFWMYKYEAVRPDAKEGDSGVMEHRACSKKGVLPWQDVTWTEAYNACDAAGMRLCTESEWQAACEGPLHNNYPYGNQYDADACNGKDHDPDCQLPDADMLLPTGEPHGCPVAPLQSECVSSYGVVDMSGNLHEWTGTQVSADPVAYRVRGGSYKTVEHGLTCQFDFIAFEPWVHMETLGFRCCMDWTP